MKPFWWDLITATIKTAGIPLTLKEIWEQSTQYRIDNNITSIAKSPINVLYAHCNWDIHQNGDNSILIQTSNRPARFFLRDLVKEDNLEQFQIQFDAKSTEEEKIKKGYDERKLHPFLVAFANKNSHFNAYLKTIYHESSLRKTKGKNEWLHPDLVGVYFPFLDYKKEILRAQRALSAYAAYLFSFEMKIILNFGNLRESYFQAVSNSSWANEGYLVAKEIDEDPSFHEELERLNNAFGIGVIQLIPNDPYASEIMVPAKIRPTIDWDSANKLASENPDFRDFLETVAKDCEQNEIRNPEKNYDKIENEDTMIEIANKLGIN